MADASGRGTLGGLAAALPGGGGLRVGILVAVVFPLAIVATTLIYGARVRRTAEDRPPGFDPVG